MTDLTEIIDGVLTNREHLKRIGDLINCEGPLLSLFRNDRSGNFFLYDWVDSNEEVNRFLVYAVSRQGMLDYLNKKVTHRSLLFQAIEGKYYFADIGPSEPFEYKVLKLKELPSEYQDIEDNLFNERFCDDAAKILLEVIRTPTAGRNELTLASATLTNGQEDRFHSLLEASIKSHLKQFSIRVESPRPGPFAVIVMDAKSNLTSEAKGKNILHIENPDFFYVRADNQVSDRKRLAFYE